ncbi:MAG TPA: hypothetical protein VJB14_10000 [Planctomycetota bacterium]|nr:hypothetical protein [Planctomycetota bacterium]
MKRSRWILLGLAALLGTGLLAAFLRPRPPEEFPLAELVPQDALFYAGFPDVRRFEELLSRIPGAWKEEDRRKLEEARPHLSGPIAFYLDAKGEWVGLARLTRAAAWVADVEGDAAVFAQTPAALERFRGRTGALRDVASFRDLKSRLFLNLESFDLKGRFGDFAALGFEIEPGDPWVIRGRAAYRPDRFRLYIERYVQAPHRAGSAESGPAAQLALTDPFLRLWDDLLEGLSAEARDRVEREMQVLRRDLLDGRDVREFLGRLGPRWGLAAVPTPHGFPALVAWLDLPDDAAREMLEKLLDRAAKDNERVSRGYGQVPAIEVEKKDGHWRMKFPWAASLRLGEAFTPSYALAGNRLVVSTCAAALSPPAVGAGDAHAAVSVKVAPAIELLASAAPYLTDDAFCSEADGMALARYVREFNPLALGALARKIPDPVERAKHLEVRRAEFVAEALAEIAKGRKYQDELARRKAEIAAWGERLSWIDRIEGSGRFMGDGLRFELRARPKRAP